MKMSGATRPFDVWKYGWQFRVFNRILELPRNPRNICSWSCAQPKA
jgi:hypothetical protein